MTEEQRMEIEEKADNYMRGRAMALSFKPLSCKSTKEQRMREESLIEAMQDISDIKCAVESIAYADNKIDWEQRRYEIAKEAMVGIIANSHDDDYRYVERGHSQNYKYKLQRVDIVHRAVMYADALIAELKKINEKEKQYE